MLNAQQAHSIIYVNANKHLEKILMKIKATAQNGFDQIQISSYNFHLVKDALLNAGYKLEYGILGATVYISWKEYNIDNN